MDLINLVLASDFQLPKETLMGKVIILHKKGDPSLLVNYRPIALLNSTYQLINLILAGRLQDLAERHGVLESSQFGFRRLHRVTDSVQKQQLLLKFAKMGDGKLIRIDLDYANAFNSAGHACLWAILEKFGVPDIDLLKSFYDLALCGFVSGNTRQRISSWILAPLRALPYPHSCSFFLSMLFCAFLISLNFTTG